MTKSSSHPILGAAFLLVCAVALAAACSFGGFITAEDLVQKSFQVSGTPTVVLETFNGSISVQGQAGESVEFDITRRGSGMTDDEARADLDNIIVETRQEGNTIYVTIRRSDLRAGNSGASVDLRLPTQANLEITTSNGHIHVEGVTGNTRLTSSNGNLTLTQASGQAAQSASLNLTTSNGRIEVEAENALVSAQTSNGQINFKGSLAASTHNFTTSNARIEISLPAASAFQVNATTSNARISSDFNVSGGTQSDNILIGSVGANAQMQINLVTSNGNIDILKN